MDGFDKQPNFFEGQPLGPEELNRIAEFSVNRQATYAGFLSGLGGIIRSVGQELQVLATSEEGLEIKILDGAAVTPSGYLLHVARPTLFDVSVARPVTQNSEIEGRWIFIHLAKQTSLEHPSQDSEFPEIKGFSEKKLGFTIIASDQEILHSDAIEVARVRLSPSTTSLKALKQKGPSNAMELGVINMLFRRYISPLGGVQITDTARFELWRGLQETRSILSQATHVFDVKEPEALGIYFYSLRTELYRSAIDEMVLRSVLADTLAIIASMFEEVRSLLASRSNVRDERIPAVDELLNRIRAFSTQTGEAISQLSQLIALCGEFSGKVLTSSHLGEHYLRINNAVKGMRQQPFQATNNVAPAGTVFTLRETIDLNALTERALVDSPLKEQIMITGKYRSGDAERIMGLAIPGGKITVPLRNLHPGKDVLVIGRNYKRRQDIEVGFSCNGKEVHREITGSEDPMDGLVTYGFVIPGELISHKDNTLLLEIKRLEITYPFLGMYIYQ